MIWTLAVPLRASLSTQSVWGPGEVGGTAPDTPSRSTTVPMRPRLDPVNHVRRRMIALLLELRIAWRSLFHYGGKGQRTPGAVIGGLGHCRVHLTARQR